MQEQAHSHPDRGSTAAAWTKSSWRNTAIPRRKPWWRAPFSHLELLEKQGFYDTCVSMKSSTVPVMVAACRLFRQRCDYPLHIGVTETGPVRMGMIKSAMSIGALLLDGIGRRSGYLSPPTRCREVYAAKEILRAAGLRKEGVNMISCPTCGRTSIDLIGLVEQVDRALQGCEKNITVAVMGCGSTAPGRPGRRMWALPVATAAASCLSRASRCRSFL